MMGHGGGQLAHTLADGLGGIPDYFFVQLGHLLKKKSSKNLRDYLKSIDFYQAPLAQGLEAFLKLPTQAPGNLVCKEQAHSFSTLQNYSLKSTYQVAERDLQKEFHSRNSNFKLSIMRHQKDKTRPLVLCLHGFLMGNFNLAQRMFKMEKLFSKGVDVAFFPWPFHGERAEHFYQQKLILPENLPLSFEGVCQALHDLKQVLLTLKSLGYEKVGLIGASLGGFLGALYSSLQNDFSFLFVTVPALDLFPILRPEQSSFRFPMNSELMIQSKQLVDVITPANRNPILDVKKIMAVYHSGDLIAHAEGTRTWIQKWQIPHSVAIAGGHWAYFDHKARARAWYQWLHTQGFIS